MIFKRDQIKPYTFTYLRGMRKDSIKALEDSGWVKGVRNNVPVLLSPEAAQTGQRL